MRNSWCELNRYLFSRSKPQTKHTAVFKSEQRVTTNGEDQILIKQQKTRWQAFTLLQVARPTGLHSTLSTAATPNLGEHTLSSFPESSAAVRFTHLLNIWSLVETYAGIDSRIFCPSTDGNSFGIHRSRTRSNAGASQRYNLCPSKKNVTQMLEATYDFFVSEVFGAR